MSKRSHRAADATAATEPVSPMVEATLKRFRDAPLDASREMIIDAVHEAAAPSLPGAQTYFRQRAVMRAFAERATDEATIGMASRQAERETMFLAASVAMNCADVEAKLAAALGLVMEKAPDLYDTDFLLIALISSAIGDLVALRDGPIVLPEGATAPDIDVARWRAAALRAAAEISG